MEFLPEAYICVASVLALPDSHAKSTNAAKQDADVNEASCLLSLLFKTGCHAQLAIIHTTIPCCNVILINQLHSICDVTDALHSDCVPKIGTSQNDFG